MAVDVVAEEGGGLACDLSELPERQQSGFDQGLEAVAYSQDQAVPFAETPYRCRYGGVAQDVCDELPAPVRFIACREASGEHEYLAGIDAGCHLVDGLEDILVRKVPEHGCGDPCACLPECLGGVVVTVCPGEHRYVDHRPVDFRPLVFEIGLPGLERPGPLHPLRKESRRIRFADVRINLPEKG